jgi:DNA-binding response OmpR family regulator
MRILLIEDEKKTAAFLTKGLREGGFKVDVACDGQTGIELARASKFDLLIVDVMLPKKDGWAVVAELRGAGVSTPVIFLTARDSVRDRVKGLELGADDYLVKPFAFSELLAARGSGNRHTAKSRCSFRRRTESHAQGVSPLGSLGSFCRPGRISNRNRRACLGH